MSVVFFRIPAHIPKTSYAKSSFLFFVFVKKNPANAPFSSFLRERCIDEDGAQPGAEPRFPSELSNVPESAQHCFLNQIVGFIRIGGITTRKAEEHLLVAAEQFPKSAGFSALPRDDEFFVTTLLAAIFERTFRIQFAHERQLRLVCQLHRILHMRPELAPS
jgi:hypothetical protein